MSSRDDEDHVSEGGRLPRIVETPARSHDGSVLLPEATSGLVGTRTSGDLAPTWSPNGKRIAFAREGTGFGDFAIYVMNADGSNQHAITHGGDNEDPAWQPTASASQ
jgi:TolB protein